MSSDLVVPDLVRTYVVYLYRHMREKNVFEIHSMYEQSFYKLSERFFKASPWPSVEAIAEHVDNDHVFALLYKEMSFRHVYAKLTPTLEQRIESWENYRALFGIILHGNVNMQLPNLWLWEMIDEFTYQFQSFAQYRAKLAQKTPEELEMLKSCGEVWSALEVCSYLRALIEKSEIARTIADERAGLNDFSKKEGYDYESSNVLRTLGYFAHVGLLRVLCLMGDYHGGLRALDGVIDLSQSGALFTKVVGCHITTMYNAGFAYMMLKRYTDAARSFNSILTHISRAKGMLSRSVNFDQVMKKNEQLYALLAMVIALCQPAHKLLDDGVATQLREKFVDKVARMVQTMDENTFDELFSFACPKFVTVSAPSFEDVTQNYNQDAYRRQLKLFLHVVRGHALHPTILSFLKLYTTIPLEKLAKLMEMDVPTLHQELLGLKQRSRLVEWRAGSASALDGVEVNVPECEFHIVGDMVHVKETKPTRQYGDYLTANIVRYERLIADIQALPPPAVA
eukprot:CAMPEP_0170142846 /NCGR_PEP_ID=MMETSP0033_2-20121228/8775_1 /TAXON_ID=195969 /ORGANISM="Dolichomastix tenuilepis, Strain CCMP3274" /LENGTH=509 /DNA_ID=CAMNT_0010379231 /DNA_START=22 /DNA_END=1551 /DNA_ORIENTATION=-